MTPLDAVSVKLVRTIDDVLECQLWLQQNRDWLAVDTETSGLDWWRGELRLVQFGDADKAWVFPWKWWAGPIRQMLDGYKDRPIVCHNLKFDAHWLEHRGGWTPNWGMCHDTQVMVSLIDGGRPSGLKLAAGRHVDLRAQRGETKLKEGMAKAGWTWATVPLDYEPYWGYAGLYTILTARLAAALWPSIQTDYRALYEIERGSGAVLYKMETKGALLDREYITVRKAELEQETEAINAWGHDTHAMSIGSPQQLAARLTVLGADLPTLPSGQLSTAGATLKLLSLDPCADLALLAAKAFRSRKARKTISAYFSNFLELADTDGRLHPSIRQLGAKTGRMSVAQPSLQNLTRGPEVRDAFIPSPGNRLVLADYDQIEMRLLYFFSKDPSLYAAIMSDDLHTATARLVYQDPSLTKNDPRRQPAKSAAFAKVYGAGLEQFAATAGIPLEEARHFLALYDATFTGVDPFIGRVIATGRQRLQDTGAAWVKTWGGRRQVASSDKVYTLVNYLIQGTAADVLKERMIYLDNAGLGEYMILPVHDEIVFDVPAEDVEEVTHLVQKVMPVGAEVFGVPLTVGIDVVNRWGDKYRPKGTASVSLDDGLELDEDGVAT